MSWSIRPISEPTGVAVAAAALALGTYPIARSLVVPDLNWCYPFLTPDSYDWLNNGYFWAGADVWPSLRPPGLPLVVALLSRLGLLQILPVLQLAALFGISALLYSILRRRHRPLVAGAAALIVFTSAYAQELSKLVMAEVWCTFFLVAAARAFLLVGEPGRTYRSFGVLLSIAFLFQYAALPAAVGFAVVVLVLRRPDLRRRDLRLAAVLTAAVVVVWGVFRRWYLAAHPQVGPHGVEALVGWAMSRDHARFFLIATLALLGLPLVPVYGAGLLRVLASRRLLRDPYRATALAVGVAVGPVFLAFYRWEDKRFLFYAFPFAVMLLADGIEALRRLAARTLPACVAVGGYGLLCLLWNLIQYPYYGVYHLALTPRDFLEVRGSLANARVVRVHGKVVSGFTRGLFDYRIAPWGCDSGPLRAALPTLKASLDRRLPPGAPVGFHSGPGWPADYWSAVNRLANVLGRPVVRPDRVNVSVALLPVEGARELERVGPYLVLDEPVTGR